MQKTVTFTTIFSWIANKKQVIWILILVLQNNGSADCGTSRTSGTRGTINFFVQKLWWNRIETKNSSVLFENSFSGIKKITINNKYVSLKLLWRPTTGCQVHTMITVNIQIYSCSKFAPNAPITPKFYQHHRRWCYFMLMFLIPGSCTMMYSLTVCWEHVFINVYWPESTE